MSMTPIPLREFATIVDPEHDNVAVAIKAVPAGTQILLPGGSIIQITAAIRPGHRFATEALPDGTWVRQYGQPFARSRGLRPGDPITEETVQSETPAVDALATQCRPSPLSPWKGPVPTFQGFARANGLTGVRNWVLIVPVSMCAVHEAGQIALQAEVTRLYSRTRYPNVDGVTALRHTGGCGCPYAKDGELTPGAYTATLRMLAQHIQHPNVGAALMIELGCEKTNFAAFKAAFGDADLTTRFGKPVARLTIQACGGTQAAIKKGLTILPELLTAANETERQPAPLSALALGVECGGSDAFSGITANPALGFASDLLISTGGRTLIGEVPEFWGAVHLFTQRAASRDVAEQILATIEAYRAYAARAGHDLAENPSPGNREGGLLNITIKSLGALAKSGHAPVQGVLPYSGWVWDRPEAGVYLVNTPGYDQLSVPGLVGAGAQIVCFTTGRGTGIGNAIAPVIKISSNTPLYERMRDDTDINAGAILSNGVPLEEMGRHILELIIRVASGEHTRAEKNGHREFALWNVEGIWL